MSQTKAQLIDAIDGTIVTADLADDAVTQAKIASGTIVNDNIDSSAGITGGKLANNTIGAAQIAAGAITNTEIDSSAAIAGSKIADFISLGNTNDRVLTASGTANSFIGEANLTFDGATLTINGTSTDTPLLLDTTNSSGSHLRFRKDGANKHFFGSGGGFGLGDVDDLSLRTVDNIIFGVGTSEKMRLTSDGKVHIGLTNGAGQFNVKNQDDAATNALEVYNDNGVRNAAFSQSSSGDGTMDLRTNGTAQNVLLRSNGDSHLSGGNVGINVASPSNRLHVKDGNPYIEIEGTSNSGDAGIFFNAKSNHWNLRADNSGSQNSFGLKSGTPASSTHTISIVGNSIDFFQNRNIYHRTTGGTHSIADGANGAFTITGLGYGWAKLQLAFYGEGHHCNVEVSVGGLMAGGGTFYGATVIANNSSSNVDVAFGQNQTSYVVTISNNVGNGGSIHGTALFTGSGGSAHPNIAFS